MRVVLYAALVGLLLQSCAQEADKSSASPPTPPAPALIYDVTKLAGKTLSEIQQHHLGYDEGCEAAKISGLTGAYNCVYQKGKVEITYINGLADWITINGVGLPWEPNSLRALGFSSVPIPRVENENMIAWNNVPGFIGVNYGKGAGNTIEFVHFKWKTD